MCLVYAVAIFALWVVSQTIMESINSHSVNIICGETGSGVRRVYNYNGAMYEILVVLS